MNEEHHQFDLLDVPKDWQATWTGMPEFISEDAKPWQSMKMLFKTKEDRHAFLKLCGEDPERLKPIWYPKMEYLTQSDKNAPATVVPPNRYPVYIISKGRADTRLTAKALEKLGIPYHIVIEPQEYDMYFKVMDAAKILQLPFSNLGQGSIPARNWVWEHALSRGALRHWILDDNIDGFYRLNRNLKTKVVSENPFTALEDFTDRYSNVALSGMQYEFFADRRSESAPFVLNTRIYSCILIKNDIPYRWRGRYNEDTDLSIRALKDGWCTILFYNYLCKKMPTMKMKGGNTDELYVEDGRLKMAESLRDQHPEIVKITRKWGRWQHHVDYSPFDKNKLNHVAGNPQRYSEIRQPH
jgi:hypothetical protein